MHLPARLIRAHADDTPGHRPALSPREQDRRDRILANALTLMAQYGRHSLTMAAFATGLRLSPAMVRRHFPDLDNLFAEILRAHLHAIAGAIGAIPPDTPNPQAARRAAYIAATRTASGNLTAAHLLLVRDRHLLPPDEAHSIEHMRGLLAETLAGPGGHAALVLLDAPDFQAPQIEAMLEAAAAHPATAPAQHTAEPLQRAAPAHRPEPPKPPNTTFSPAMLRSRHHPDRASHRVRAGPGH
jgi:AcrR family transcriptional regulator